VIKSAGGLQYALLLHVARPLALEPGKWGSASIYEKDEEEKENEDYKEPRKSKFLPARCLAKSGFNCRWSVSSHITTLLTKY
jgi:hypothetical protein